MTPGARQALYCVAALVVGAVVGLAPSPWPGIAAGLVCAFVAVMIGCALYDAWRDRYVDETMTAETLQRAIRLAVEHAHRYPTQRIEITTRSGCRVAYDPVTPTTLPALPLVTCEAKGMTCEPDDGGDPILSGGRTFRCLRCSNSWETPA